MDSEMKGIVGFEGFKILCIIGTEEHERCKEQELYVDLKVESNLALAASSDHLKDTINYVSLAKICQQVAHQGKFHLLEKYVFEVLTIILATFDVSWAWIRVKKPGALEHAEHAFVELKLFKS